MHVFAKEFSELARKVEHEFFRIERENRWLSSAINGLIAGISVGLVSWLVATSTLVSGEGDLLLFACLGSSAASVVFAPVAKSNSLRSIILAYVSASIVCLVLFPVHTHSLLPIPAQCFLAVSFSIFLMRLIGAMHPAAIGSALAFIIYDRDIQSLIILMLAILGLLTIVKLLAYIYLEELRFNTFHKEFRRGYYGEEMTVTLVPDTGEQIDEQDVTPDGGPRSPKHK